MLPLLDALDALLPVAHRLEGWSCIYVQHILRSNYYCAQFLVDRGLPKDALRIFGKAYSTSPATLTLYRDNGFFTRNIGIGYDYAAPFDDALIAAIAVEIQVLIAAGTKNLLLIDEGGLAIQAAAALPSIQDVRIAAVELTARGAHHYPLLEGRAPIIDVARSDVKKRVEAPLIAASMVELLMERVEALTRRPFSGLRLGIIGAGAIGGALQSQLRKKGAIVKSFDNVPERSGTRTLAEALKNADIIISSTGLGLDWAPILDTLSSNVILANCGSSDIEFQPWRLRTHFLSKGSFVVQSPGSPWAGNIVMSTPATKVTLLAGGFPVNFNGSPDPIASETIQLTRTILMAGAIQAALAPTPGVAELDSHLQATILLRYYDLTGGGALQDE